MHATQRHLSCFGSQPRMLGETRRMTSARITLASELASTRLFALLGIRGAIRSGFSYGVYDLYGRDQGLNETESEEQLFFTAGINSPICLEQNRTIGWAVVYDHLNNDNFGEEGNDIAVSQLRGQIGYALDFCNEIGVTMAFQLSDDIASTLGDGATIKPQDQVNIYWRHTWEYSVQTQAYIGWAEKPGDVVLGLRGNFPASPTVDFFGSAQAIFPSTSAGDLNNNGVENSFSEESWNISFGMIVYFGRNECRTCDQHRGDWPMLPVADNATFALTAPLGSL